VVRAWLVASRLADHRALLTQMSQQRAADARAVTRWLLGLARVLERTARWVLNNVPQDASPATVVALHLDGLAALRDGFADAVVGEERATFEKRVAEIRELGADVSFSRRLITLRFLDQLLEILAIARHADVDPAAAARTYYWASEILHIPWLRRRALAAGRQGQWEHRAAQILADDLSRAHREATAHMLRWEAHGDRALQRSELERFHALLDELRRDEPSLGLAAITVAVRELTAVVDGFSRRPAEGRPSSARPTGRAGGFTLLELVIALLLISMVTTYGILQFSGYFQRAAAQRAAQVFARDLTLARGWATRGRQPVVIRFYESGLWYEVAEQATGTQVAVRRFGTNADIDLSAVTLDFTGDSVVFDAHGVADLSGASGPLGTATFSSGGSGYTVSFNSMGASKLDRT
jgi:prepilin-type N-terminal cleavage/methylation domain-containing protein